MARVAPEHSRSAVRRAGEAIGAGSLSPQQLADARDVVSNFRSAHSYPLLAVTVHVRTRALAVSGDAIVARRMKRLPTIIDKLERYPRMNVTTMHDLGGCRVVLGSVAEVDALAAALKGAKRAQNKIVREYDYIHTEPGPKANGYRGVHLVYEYDATLRDFAGLRVELQVRTELQHAWATAVETMDLFANSQLKYDKADPDLHRYFALVSSLMALQEKTPQVPGAEGSRAELSAELRDLDQRLGVLARLMGYAEIPARFAGTSRRSALTLELDRSEQKLTVTRHETMADAERRLAELEAIDDDNLDAVLVAIKQIAQLQSAYPNYFANTSAFTDFVTRAIV